MDLLIKNAIAIDLNCGKETQAAVGIENGTFEVFDEGKIPSDLKTEKVLDAKGAYLIPDMIDFHTHLYTGGSSFGVNADLLLPSGATMAVDMGTAGTAGYEAFHQLDLIPRTIRIKSFINLSPLGQPGSGISEPLTTTSVQPDAIRKLVRKYPDEIRGIKVRISEEIVGDLGLEPLDRALKLGEELGLPICVHTTNPPESTGEIVKRLRPGDAYSHLFHGKGRTILGDGKVCEEFFQAKKRGVFLEIGNGRMNFNFPVAEAAMEQGLCPDIISSDATARTLANSPDMKDLPFVMSKFWNMGMPLHEVIAAVTKNPMRCLGLGADRGTLKTGAPANLTLMRVLEQDVRFSDSDGNVRNGSRRLAPEMTMINGRIVYLQGMAELSAVI